MASFRSNEEYFEAVAEFVAKLEAAGLGEAAASLMEGFSCLNGLTDGWAQFLESLEHVQASYGPRLELQDRATLEAFREAAHSAVYRRWR